MTETPTGPEAAEPTEAEVRAYLEQLRNAGVDQVVAEVATALINAAQVKLGRRDARLLLDLVGAVADQSRGRVPDELSTQLDQALAQLRLAQVDAEQQLAGQGQADGNAHDGPATNPGEAADATGSSPDSVPPSGSAKRLWTPGA